jgi:hypothetical protein
MFSIHNEKSRAAFNLLYKKIPLRLRPSYRVFCNTNIPHYKPDWKKEKDLSEFISYLYILALYGYSFDRQDYVIYILWTAFKRWRLDHNMESLRKAKYHRRHVLKRDHKLLKLIYRSWLDNQFNVESELYD